MKRHNLPAGWQQRRQDSLQSASNGATDRRDFPGARRPGRFGAELVTQKGLKVVEIDAGRNCLSSKARPGAPAVCCESKKRECLAVSLQPSAISFRISSTRCNRLNLIAES